MCSYLGDIIRSHHSYPVDFPIPPEISLEQVLPEERQAIIDIYCQCQNHINIIKNWLLGPPERIWPIYRAPDDISAYIEKWCKDLTISGLDDDVDHWLYPGFYAKDGYIVAAIIAGFNMPSLQSTWPHLIALDISSKNLSEVPLNICASDKLKYLAIGYNRLTTLPAEIGKLKDLKALSMQNNNLIHLPAEFCHLSPLMYLNLEKSHLTTVPSQLDGLNSLLFMNLKNNNLRILPDTLGELISLTTLDLSYNSLSTLPSTISQLKNLKYIALQYNIFIEYTLELWRLPFFCRYNLEGNPILTLYGIPRKKYKWISEHKAVLT